MEYLKFVKKNRYKFAPHCPCGKSNKDNKFIPYEMERESDMGKYGYCHACGETFLPKKEETREGTLQKENRSIIVEKPISFIDVEIVNKTFDCFAENNFVKYLLQIFDEATTLRLLNEYHIGTSKKVWYNQSIAGYSTIFYQIDIEENIRTGQIILYDHEGHRVHGCQTWVHSELIKNKYVGDDFNMKQCFFGEHLLNKDLYPQHQEKSIAIVEAPKTAIIASVYYPDYVWLACNGSNGLTLDKCQILKGKNILLINDLDENGYKSFENRVADLKLMKINANLLDLYPEITHDPQHPNYKNDIADLIICK